MPDLERLALARRLLEQVQGREPEEANVQEKPPASPAVPAAMQCRAEAIRYLCLDRGRGRGRVRDRLLAHYESAVVESCLDDLTEDGYLDEALAARRLLSRHSQKRAKGDRYLQLKLREAGISPEVAARAMGNLQSEAERLRDLVFNYTLVPQERVRAERFLASRGFSYELIRQVLDERQES